MSYRLISPPLSVLRSHGGLQLRYWHCSTQRCTNTDPFLQQTVGHRRILRNCTIEAHVVKRTTATHRIALCVHTNYKDMQNPRYSTNGQVRALGRRTDVTKGCRTQDPQRCTRRCAQIGHDGCDVLSLMGSKVPHPAVGGCPGEAPSKQACGLFGRTVRRPPVCYLKAIGKNTPELRQLCRRNGNGRSIATEDRSQEVVGASAVGRTRMRQRATMPKQNQAKYLNTGNLLSSKIRHHHDQASAEMRECSIDGLRRRTNKRPDQANGLWRVAQTRTDRVSDAKFGSPTNADQTKQAPWRHAR